MGTTAPAASDPSTVPQSDTSYRLRPERCIIEVSGRIGPLAPVRYRFKAVAGAWTSDLHADPSAGPAWLDVVAQPVLASPAIALRRAPRRRSMASTLHVTVRGAPGGTSGPAVVEVTDGETIAWRFSSRLRIVSETEESVLVDLHGRLASADDRRTYLSVWLRAAAEFVR